MRGVEVETMRMVEVVMVKVVEKKRVKETDWVVEVGMEKEVGLQTCPPCFGGPENKPKPQQARRQRLPRLQRTPIHGAS